MVDAARLRRKSDISLVRAEGRIHGEQAFVMRARRTDAGAVRVAVSAMREVGGAVRRNRARRRVREAIRIALRTRAAAPATDLLVSARRAALDAPAAELAAAADRALGTLLDR